MDHLPPLTGSALFDPWRVRLREQLVAGPTAAGPRRPTRSEILLWEALQTSSRDWIPEFPTRYGYRLDFYCADVKLAVEVDGSSHWGQHAADRDSWRDLVHERMGIRTRRFSAREVEEDVEAVARAIEEFTERRARELARVEATPPKPPAAEADLDVDERVLLFPPDEPGWSMHLPACRTVLPEQPGRRSVLSVLSAMRS